MPIQVGTVDGLINITDKIKTCFVEAIDKFDKEVFSQGILEELPVALGDAFQRYTYPVYSGNATEYTLESLKKEVTTKTGNKQSPAYVTYCKKMGLLRTDAETYFELTPLGKAIKEGDITLEEYALVYMSKQGIFVDEICQGNLLVDIAELFNKNSSITTESLSSFIAQKYQRDDFLKTRFDIILGALVAAKLLTKVGNTAVYVLSGIYQASILKYIYENRRCLGLSLLDSNKNYSSYIGDFKNGIFDVLNKSNSNLIQEEYPNLVKYINNSMKTNNNLLLQQIFYGAPGTGKSHGVKETTDKIASEFVFRTTFHPDSDYSTFVGAYKPTMEKADKKIYTAKELVDKLSEIKNSGTTYPCQKFAAKYWYSLKQLSANDIKEIIAACGFTDSMKTEVDKSIPVGEELSKNNTDSKIVYTFVPQAFLKAYVAAWKNQEQSIFLVIEEINRGNCAQIFGDIFQLLDRNENGESEYPIKADQDIQNYLAEVFADYDNLPDTIKSGEELLLPNNLYIWATMNTSDQSLFPIDSAFKRRWDWKYTPIVDAGKGWTIEVGNNQYDWWKFLDAINAQINDTTSSEDKKMGYFFCKACPEGKINADKFVNKVVFYLWNDVFKDYELPTAFKKEGDGYFCFNDFYTAPEATINQMMKNLKVKAIGEPEETPATESTEEQTAQ